MKRLGKFHSRNGEYRCGICGTVFPKTDGDDNRIAQKVYLKPSTYLKFGNEPVAIIPKICYRCNEKIKRKIIQVFT